MSCLGSSPSTKCSKRNFVKENSKSQIQKHFNHEYASGTFTIHHPSRCYQTIDSHPIHLKRENSTDGKEFVRILTQAFIRDLLVPAASKLYPVVLHVTEMDRIKLKSLRLTNDEKQVTIENLDNAHKCLRDASEKRKMLIRKWNKIND